MCTSAPSGSARRYGPAVALLCSLTLALAACGGDSDPDPGSGPGAEATPPPGVGTPTAGAIICKDYDKQDVVVPPKSITIRNNSAGQIYPVLATSTNAKNEWLQGCWRTTEAWPTELVYKLYVNAGVGIPPGSEITITLPLYSELGSRQYITWWNGGRVLLADHTARLRNDEDKPINTPASVVCRAQGTTCSLSTYSSKVQFPEDAFAQLSEYTFGDSVEIAGQAERLLKPENVGYNISYVDHVYMPVAIGVRGNPYIGYSGSAQGLEAFRGHLRSFLSGRGEGWPVYNMSELRLPGGYNIFAQRGGFLVADSSIPVQPPDGKNPPVLTVMKCINKECTPKEQRDLQFGQAVQNIQDLWGACVDWGREDISLYTKKKYPVDCASAELKEKMSLVKAFFAENHKKYLALYRAGSCVGTAPQIPQFQYWEAIKHIYGWVPFNEGCGAGANALAHTTVNGRTHAEVQAMYIKDLQYNYKQPAVQADPTLTFNHFVKLIHDDLGMSAYGFSVDDAVGFMTELGQGLVFTVGGVAGLENPKPFNYADGFSLLVGALDSMAPNKPLIKKYGACSLNADPADPRCEQDKQDVTMPEHSLIVGFRIGTMPSYPMKIRFTDMEDNVYTVPVKEKFGACTGPLNTCPPNKDRIVDKAACSVVTPSGAKHPKSDRWCANANPNQGRDVDEAVIKNFLSFPVPVQYLN